MDAKHIATSALSLLLIPGSLQAKGFALDLPSDAHWLVFVLILIILPAFAILALLKSGWKAFSLLPLIQLFFFRLEGISRGCDGPIGDLLSTESIVASCLILAVSLGVFLHHEIRKWQNRPRAQSEQCF